MAREAHTAISSAQCFQSERSRVTSIKDSLRRLAWRAGRKLYCVARGDFANDPHRNGEYWLLERAIFGSADKAVLFDVGANIGEWTLRATALAAAAGRPIRVIAFEPGSAAREILSRRTTDAANVEVVPVALSDSEGESDFFSDGAASGTSSLNPVSGAQRERVRLATLDGFMRENGIERVDILKIDTEGFDLNVLRGAERALTEGRVDLVQFEYNWRWLLNKANLLQVFELIKESPYRFGKLVGNSVIYFDKWHFELDRYFENNYVLIRKGLPMEALGLCAEFNGNNVAVYRDWRD